MFQEKSPTRLESMLNHPEKAYNKPSGVKGILAKLFRKILFERNIEIHSWSRLLDAYIRKLERETGMPVRSGTRGNLTKSLYNEQMSILNFCRGLKFIGVKQFKINIQLEFSNGETHECDSGVVILSRDKSIDNFDDLGEDDA